MTTFEPKQNSNVIRFGYFEYNNRAGLVVRTRLKSTICSFANSVCFGRDERVPKEIVDEPRRTRYSDNGQIWRTKGDLLSEFFKQRTYNNNDNNTNSPINNRTMTRRECVRVRGKKFYRFTDYYYFFFSNDNSDADEIRGGRNGKQSIGGRPKTRESESGNRVPDL